MGSLGLAGLTVGRMGRLTSPIKWEGTGRLQADALRNRHVVDRWRGFAARTKKRQVDVFHTNNYSYPLILGISSPGLLIPGLRRRRLAGLSVYGQQFKDCKPCADMPSHCCSIGPDRK